MPEAVSQVAFFITQSITKRNNNGDNYIITWYKEIDFDKTTRNRAFIQKTFDDVALYVIDCLTCTMHKQQYGIFTDHRIAVTLLTYLGPTYYRSVAVSGFLM